MALNWDWNNKIGELTMKNDEKEFNVSVYKGNALAIFVYEFTDKDGVEKYQLTQFFCDKQHFKNCAADFNYAQDWVKLTLWKVDSDMWILLKDLAKRGVNIEIRQN